MLQRILYILGALLLLFVSIEAVALLRLKHSINDNAAYWRGVAKNTKDGSITYVALGDSTAQGIGASEPGNGYVGLLANDIARATCKSVHTINLSVSGARIHDVIEKQLPQLHKYKPDVVTIEIGANDATQFDAQKFEREFRQLLPALPRGTIVSNLPYFGGRIKRSSEVTQANKIIARAVKEQGGLRLADVYSATKVNNSVRNYAADWFHPSDRGYRNWRDAFWRPLLDKRANSKLYSV
ncbi:MAG: esterase [Candidatus Saccharibacteria bacterium]|nr:esterase [Candidatus Saccharibacteria bacterium]